VAAPDLASLRAMYGRGNTLFEHQQLACEVLDFHWLSEQQRRALSGALRMELSRTRDRQQLLIFARRWLYEHRLLIMHERSIRSTIVKVRQQYEAALAKGIHATIADERLAGWGKALVTPRESGVTLQSWLWAPPSRACFDKRPSTSPNLLLIPTGTPTSGWPCRTERALTCVRD
jgi:hypothetical protein